MSTVVCEGVQTNYLHESSPFIETTTRTTTLTLKLNNNNNNPSSSENRQTQFTQNDSPRSCWDFRISLYNSSQDPKFEKETSSYVPPTTNKPLPKVCLELCTENLGSESGSDASDHSILSLLTHPDFDGSEKPKQKQQRKSVEKMQAGCASRSFPPPLTTMRGFNPIRVRPKREEGRLVIEAVEEPAACSYFRSERSHGRLRLCFWDNEEQEQEEENEGDCDQEEEEEEEEEEEGLGVREDMIGNNLNGGVEIGNQKFQRRSRCKEGGSSNSNGLCNWEPFLVAT